MSTFEIIMAIINVAALIIVPIAAVFIGQKLQDRNQKRKDKMEIFRSAYDESRYWLDCRYRSCLKHH